MSLPLDYFECLDRDFLVTDRGLDLPRTKWCEIIEININGTVDDSIARICMLKNQSDFSIAQWYWDSRGVNSSVEVACSDEQWLAWTPGAVIAFIVVGLLAILPIIAWLYAVYREKQSRSDTSFSESLFLSFDIRKSYNDLATVRAGGGTQFLDAFRVVSMTWIILGHCDALFGLLYTNHTYWLHNIVGKERVLNSSYVIAVNTFFWTGAYLGAGGMLKKLSSPGM